MEKEINGQLPFLDILTYTRKDNTIGHRIHRKETFTNGYLLYTSHHPMAHKIGVIDTQLIRPLRLSDEESRDEDIKTAFTLLKDRLYPENLLHKRFQIVKQKEELRKSTPSQFLKELKEENKMKPRVILPFIDQGTYKIAKFLRFSLGVEIGYYPGIKLGTILSNFKEKKKENNNIGVYILRCKNCEAFYIGETSKGILERGSQHKADCKSQNPNSAVANHMAKCGHEPGDMTLIEYEKNDYFRKVKEGLYIRAARLIFKDKLHLIMNISNGFRTDPQWSSRLVEFFIMKLKEHLVNPHGQQH